MNPILKYQAQKDKCAMKIFCHTIYQHLSRNGPGLLLGAIIEKLSLKINTCFCLLFDLDDSEATQFLNFTNWTSLKT